MSALDDLAARYNYAAFVLDKVVPLLDFEHSPPLGKPAPNFPLWDLEGRETTLQAIWRQHDFTVVEFGSFT